ncbi:hypothetical protein ZHAS_00014143 [Anopheles sinensis]|uniref:Uncharacterized protein n=1 Tax=Anopheles sinensis TaxID=74873 RepID=A0A084W7F1_ANOSI|nr:hypothetical protein ZHAS_00014143 [Anopheles sinensis]
MSYVPPAYIFGDNCIPHSHRDPPAPSLDGWLTTQRVMNQSMDETIAKVSEISGIPGREEEDTCGFPVELPALLAGSSMRRAGVLFAYCKWTGIIIIISSIGLIAAGGVITGQRKRPSERLWVFDEQDCFGDGVPSNPCSK